MNRRISKRSHKSLSVMEQVEARVLLSDVAIVAVTKSIDYDQTSTAAATIHSTNPYQFDAFVQETAASDVSSASVTPPGLSAQALTLDASDYKFELKNDYANQTALDDAYPNGTYSMTIDAVHDGTKILSLGVTGNAYPTAPYISNFNSLNGFNAADSFQLTWSPMSNGTANDYIIVEVDNNNSGNEVFQTPQPGTAGALAGTATSYTIPAGTLAAGGQYDVSLIFIKVSSTDTTHYPGVTAAGVYVALTEANFYTAGVTFSFVPQPANPALAGPLAPVAIDVEDTSDNLVSSFNGNISMEIASGTGPGGGATLGGTTTVTAVNGIASFTNLSLNTPGDNYQLSAVSNSTVVATSSSFVIGPASAILSGGILTVNGVSSNDNTINLTTSSGSIIATVNGLQSQPFPVGSVTGIVINGNGGNDTITVDASITANATITGGTGADSIQGGSGNDFIIGGALGSTLEGGAGNDELVGGAGNDFIGGQAGDDTVLGGGGNDSLYGGVGDDLIGGGAGNDSIYGGAGNDFLVGGGGDDLVAGAGGNDTIYGGAGDDTLWGGGGTNIMYGNTGNDDFVTNAGSTNQVYGGPGSDTLHSFGSDTEPSDDVESILIDS